MKIRTASDHSFEFYFSDIDTLVLVENVAGGVRIRASKDAVPPQRKLRFIWQLATEGFIPDSFQWLSDMENPWSRVQWLVDVSWVKLHPDNLRRTNKIMVRVLTSAAVIWLGMLTTLCFHWPR